MTSMWIVRCDAGKRYDDFRELSAVGIGWPEVAEVAQAGADRKTLVQAYVSARPGIKQQSALAGISQLHRFIHEMKVGDLVATYSPSTRKYLVGAVTGASFYDGD